MAFQLSHASSLLSRRSVGLLLLIALAIPFLGGAGLPTASAEDDAPKYAEPAHDKFPELLPFNESEWTTMADYPLMGDPAALRVEKERSLRIAWQSYPPTLRTDGPNSNLVQTRQIHALMYETMVGIHSQTEDFIPSLATHWKIETDDAKKVQTFTFRLNPKARWADGSELTSMDVYYSFWHRVQEDRKAPTNVMTFGEGFEQPEILDKYTIRVTTKKLNWRLFLYFGGMMIYPAKYIHIPGEKYLEDYNWTFMPGSGPYMMKQEDLKKGTSLTITRRHDWWAEDERWAKHTYNFEKIKYIVVRDREMQYQKFKAGDLDFYVVGKAQRWAEEIPTEKKIKNGWIQRRKIHNQAPEGFAGFCFNMRKPPFNDKRVRMAFTYLFNREALMEKLFFNEYEYTNSHFPGRDWGAGDENEQAEYDPDFAQELLAEAGYKTRNADGYLVGSDGKVLEVTLRYGFQGWERIWLVVKKYYEDAGIKFNLELIDYATLLKQISDRQFKITFQSWGALLFPNPETSWRSSLADQKANNNIPGFKNARVDELCELYNVEFDRKKQKEITREIDRIVFNEYPYALGWYASSNRILYWDRFGHPSYYFPRIEQTPSTAVIATWWFDPAKDAVMRKAMAAGEKIKQGPKVVKPWDKDGKLKAGFRAK